MHGLRTIRVAALVAALLAWPAGASAALPDLVADPVERPGTQEYHWPDGTKSFVLRFDGYIHNRGAGPLAMRGREGASFAMPIVEQLVDGIPRRKDTAQILWEPADGHSHWHLKRIARYSLGIPGGPEVAPATKVGFCLLDSEKVDPSAGPLVHHAECEKHNQDATTVSMGLSAGWRDTYDRELQYQWVDITDVAPGRYEARSEIDPENYVDESDEVNPRAAVPVTVTGVRSVPATLTGVSPAATTSVALGTETFGPLAGSREVRIDRAPDQGSLNVPAGVWTTASEVRYSPRPGVSGTDAFTFSARDSGSAYPRNPVPATVSLALASAAPAPAVDGPGELVVGTGAQYRGAAGAAWAVDGIRGGDARVGTVTEAGLYTAPASVPAGETITLSATAGDGQTAARTVRIVRAPVAQAAPTPADDAFFTPVGTSPSAGDASRPPAVAIGRMSLTRSHPYVAAAILPTRSGTLRVGLYRGTRRLAACATRVRADTPYVCRLRVPRRAGRGLKVVARLSAAGRTVSKARRVPDARHPQ